ncbi:FAD-binding oxidoreductase [Pseudomonas sp. R2.Fl]|nr:FAD-binding oxidoreductase [Pseudomonas sp. R2.Fl]
MDMASRQPSVIVVGAGIVGASLAYHLARRNVRVTLIDRAGPAAGVTRQSFAWINVSYGLPEAYPDLRRRAITEWHRVEGELGGRLRIDWSGALTWHDDPAETERFARESAAMGHDVRLVGRVEVAALEPNLINPPDHAAFAATEGSVDPVAATELLVQAAREAGADIRLDTDVLSLAVADGRVTGVATSGGVITADTVVLAAGVEARALVSPLDIDLPLDASPSILMRFRTPHRLVGRIVANRHMEVRPSSDTLMLGAEDYIDDSVENGPQAVAARALAAVRSGIDGGEAVELTEVRVGMRPFPRDRQPIVGRVSAIPGLYLSVMHAGVILAPVTGRLMASEIAQDAAEPLLMPYNLARF